MLFSFLGARLLRPGNIPVRTRLISENNTNEVSGVFTNTFRGVPDLPETVIIKGALAILNGAILLLT